MSAPFRLIDNEAAWDSVADALAAATALAFDLEADGFHRYPERTALLQVGLPGGEILIVDPLAIPDLGPLATAMTDPARPLILHSGSYDVRALDRDFGLRVGALIDTALAAQFCGERRLGLGNVLRERLDIDLPKPKRLQRFDWSRRPLPDDALAYAAGDVEHLFALAEDTVGEVERLGRRAWLDEECARLAAVRWEAPPPPEEAFRRVKGARDLDDAQRAVLRALFAFREVEAVRSGRPPHYVLSNAAMLAIAVDSAQDPSRVRGIGGMLRGDGMNRLRAAIRDGLAAAPEPWPRPRGRNPWTPEARDRLQSLKAWRRGVAEGLDLDPGIVWPAAHLERLALEPSAEPRSLDEGSPPWIREWQWNTLGESLIEAVARIS